MKKTCTKCGIEKSLDDFPLQPRGKLGYHSWCKDCLNADCRDKYAQRRERKLAKMRAYDAAHPGRKNDDWKLKHEKCRAHNIIAAAIRGGRLVPMPCIICGNVAEAHHPDYSKPLDVVWLCRSHHRQTHSLANACLRNKSTD